MNEILQKNELFQNMNPEEIRMVLGCIGGRTKNYRKGEYVFMEGEGIPRAGIVLKGTVHALKLTGGGDELLVNRIGAGEVFGLAHVCAGVTHIPLSLLVTEPSEVLFIEFHHLVHTCRNACGFHTEVIKNTLRVLARKNLLLDSKLYYLSHKTIRERILSYLEDQSLRAGSPVFTIPFNRKEMAEFLCADRSALSRELSSLRDEGLLDFQKNKFRLLTLK